MTRLVLALLALAIAVHTPSLAVAAVALTLAALTVWRLVDCLRWPAVTVVDPLWSGRFG